MLVTGEGEAMHVWEHGIYAIPLSSSQFSCEPKISLKNCLRKSIETDPEMAQMIQEVDKNIKIVIIIVFHLFKKLEERLNMLNRDMEVVKSQ